MSRYRGDPEGSIQARVVKLYRLCGCQVYPTSQYRISRQSLGLPDLYVVHPFGGAWWQECKSPTGKQREAQVAFQRAVEAVGVTVVVGGYDEAFAELAKRRIVSDQTKRAS